MFYKLVSLSLVLLGVLHIFLDIQTPTSEIPKFILLSANILFIGFSILLVTNATDVAHSWAAIVLSVINSIMVLNHRV